MLGIAVGLLLWLTVKANRLDVLVQASRKWGEHMAISATTQAVVDAVAAEKTESASAIALLGQLTGLIQSADDLAALKQAAADLTANTATVAAAVTANTPAAPAA